MKFYLTDFKAAKLHVLMEDRRLETNISMGNPLNIGILL